MLNDLLEELGETSESVRFSQDFLRDLRNYRRRLVRSIQNSSRALQAMSDKNLVAAEYTKSIVSSLQTVASDFLEQSILDAVRSNQEYNYHMFLDALLEVARTPGLISIFPTGVGWATRITVDIEFLGYAGTLNDWAKGVAETRRQFNVGKGDPEKATKLWKEKFYRKGPYNKIITNRIKNSGRPAAFWLLLDKGTVSLSSDRGGTAYPHYYRPTNFLDKAQDRIKKEFNSGLRQVKETYIANIDLLKKEIVIAERTLENLDNLISFLSIELRKNRRVMDQFDRLKPYIDQNKLDDVLIRVRNNLEVATTAEGRVELTASGSGRRIRPSLTFLRNVSGTY